MKTGKWILAAMALILLSSSSGWTAYHHEGERDAGKFLEVYPDKAGTKLDHCALCHQGGEYEKKPDVWVQAGSCQWCHRTYGYDASGGTEALEETLNAFGRDYKEANRTAQAIRDIADQDSDGDTYDNATEIAAGRFPGSDDDHPGLTEAPYRIYTRDQLEAMTQHTQFLLMNTSRSGDFYAEYTGVPMKELLDDAGILESATDITVYAPDGWSQGHPLTHDESLDMYHVYGNMPDQSYQYPPATYFHNPDADQDLNMDYGWCDYSAPSCYGRRHGDSVSVSGGLKAILALKRDGAYLTSGVLNDENKLDGSGPFRVVVPQKYPNAPDQSSKSDNQNVIWPYNYEWDHNAGSCTRSATIIKVNPLPAGMTDINTLEAGWSYIDQGKIIIYGAIDGTDSNGNGILDSEEAGDSITDFDNDGTPDYQDTDTARFRHSKGNNTIVMNCSNGKFAAVQAINDTDASITQAGKPEGLSIPYGVIRFLVTGLSDGEEITLRIAYPENVSTEATYYKITDNGWNPIVFGDNDGDNIITITLKDGDPATDADGIANGVITDPGALVTPNAQATSGSSSSCFITTLE